VATDVNLQRLSHLRAPVEVRRHDIARDDLESAAYDLVHCRLGLEHLTEPVVAPHKMATAVAPGGWLVVEEADFGLVEFAGAAESPPGSIVLRYVFTRWAAAGVIDSYLGRRLPGLVGALGAEAFGVDAVTQIGGPGDPATKRFAWPGRPPAREPRRSASPRTTCAVSTGLSPIPPSSSASPFSRLGASYHAPAINVVHTCRRTAAAPALLSVPLYDDHGGSLGHFRCRREFGLRAFVGTTNVATYGGATGDGPTPDRTTRGIVTSGRRRHRE
jgi:hypothetical protein